MMLSTLKRRAQQSTALRNHRMRWTAPYHGEYRSIQHAECIRCGAQCSISTRPLPLPNEIDAGGAALAINCGPSILTVAQVETRQRVQS